MKRIGAITYYRFNNYGTCLQAYALCKALKENCGQDDTVQLIDCRFKEMFFSQNQIFMLRIKRLFINLMKPKRTFTLLMYRKAVGMNACKFNEFIDDYIPLSEHTYQYASELDVTPPNYDVYVTGSDQVWSPKIRFFDALFLGFVPQQKVRAAYAPSIGVASYTDEQKVYVKKHLSSYNYVSCRERYGAKILNDLSPVKVETVLDPTLIINSDAWKELSIKPEIDEPYILCYFIGDRPYYRHFAKQLSKQTCLPLVFIPVSFQDFSRKNKLLWQTGPREFLGLIDHAAIVLTDSFHGTIFSINFNKTFYSFTKHSGIDSMDNLRIVDVLERMALKDRLVLEYKRGEQISYSEINYARTNDLLAKEREVSTEYLKRIIGTKQ